MLSAMRWARGLALPFRIDRSAVEFSDWAAAAVVSLA
jgi:hypothetical protein